MVHNVKLGKNMRSVSIVGIGATPFFNGVQNETYKRTYERGTLWTCCTGCNERCWSRAKRCAVLLPRICKPARAEQLYYTEPSGGRLVWNERKRIIISFGRIAVPVTLHWRKQYSQSPVERMMLCLQDAANREQECQMETHRIICVFHLLQKYYSRIWIPSLTVLMEDTLEVVLV